MKIEEVGDNWIYAEDNNLVGEDGFNHWAVDYVIDLALHENHQELWKFIKYVFPKKMEPHSFGVLAAGAMENLLNIAGEIYIDEIEELAKINEKFRELLGGVWPSEIDKDVWERIEKVRVVAK